ncbi:MAG: hypothetical protein V2A77_07735 [Pseudomonadota bacterium]
MAKAIPLKLGPLGRLVMTRGVTDNIAEDINFSKFVIASIARHANADWGDLSAEDKKANDQALKDGDRLLSAYEKPGQPKIWIITEWDRSVTMVLFPEEY